MAPSDGGLIKLEEHVQTLADTTYSTLVVDACMQRTF
jgi:hypothetical protein